MEKKKTFKKMSLQYDTEKTCIMALIKNRTQSESDDGKIELPHISKSSA